MFSLFGGGMYDPDPNRVTPDRPENIATFKWFARLIEKMGGFEKVNAFAAGSRPAPGGNNPFFQGKIAMMFNGQWNTYWAHLYAPNLDFDVAPFPYPKDHPERALTSWYGGNMFCIPRQNTQKKRVTF